MPDIPIPGRCPWAGADSLSRSMPTPNRASRIGTTRPHSGQVSGRMPRLRSLRIGVDRSLQGYARHGPDPGRASILPTH